MAGETEGFVKIVADKKYDEVLGVHMIGLRSTELVAEATLALRLESTVEELIRTIHAHPTMAEAVGEAAHAVHGAAIHCKVTVAMIGSFGHLNECRLTIPIPDDQFGDCYGYRCRDAADGRVDRRRHDRPLDQEGRRPGRARRAAVRDFDRQGRCGNSVACRRRRHRNPRQGGRNRSGQQRRRGHRPAGAQPRRAAEPPRRAGAAGAAPRSRSRADAAGRRQLGAAAGDASRRARGSDGDSRQRRAAAGAPTATAAAPRPSEDGSASGRRRSFGRSRRSTTSTSRRFTGTGIAGRVTKNDILAFIGGADAASGADRRRAAPQPRRPPPAAAPAPRRARQPRRATAALAGQSRADVGHAQEDRRAHDPEPAHVGARALGVRSELRTRRAAPRGEESRLRASRREADLPVVHPQSRRRRAARRAGRQRLGRRRQHRLPQGCQRRDCRRARLGTDRAGRSRTRTRRTCWA